MNSDSRHGTSWRSFACGIFLLPLAGFFPLPGARAEGAFFPVAWERLSEACLDAALSPGTWVPLATAGVLSATGWDDDLSRWAWTATPVFGSRENADRMSDYLAGAAHMANVVTSLAVPSRGGFGGWTLTRAKIFTGVIAGNSLTFSSTGLIKVASRRYRPDTSDDMSFPSGHASNASVNSTMACRSIEFLPLPPAGRRTMQVGVAMLTAGTAWARVEAQKHYPTDVLAGAAIGYFIGSLLSHLVFDGPGSDVALTVAPGGSGPAVGFRARF